MVIVTFLCLFYVLLYCGYIVRLIRGFGRQELFRPTCSGAVTGFSIVIPVRNESGNLGRLLESVSELEYPRELFEVIFIDDASTDDSATIINRWRMQHGSIPTTLIDNVQMTASPKKNAILRAMPIAIHPWIITTDADCRLPETWLYAYDGYIRTHHVEMIAGPVVYSKSQSVSGHFQRLDFLSLQGVTIGSFGLGRPFMCNGANFAYTKAFFREIGGFQGNDHIASGDDVFLMQKAAGSFPEKLGYIKSPEAIVETRPENTWKRLFHQRVRWAAKAVAYDNAYADDLSIVVLLANLAIIASIVLGIAGLMHPFWVAALFVIKLVPDWIMLHKANGFLKSYAMIFPPPVAKLYPIFIVVIAFYTLVGSYTWKGRKFRL